MTKWLWRLRKKTTLPLRWYFQKMTVIDSVVYPEPRVLLVELEELRAALPAIERTKREEAEFIKGRISMIEELLYDKKTRR